jgi:predicted amidohydrolase
VPGGYTTPVFKKIAKKTRLHIIFGIAQKHKRKYYNAAVYISPKGKTEVYQKVHLFEREKLFFTRGKSFKVVSAGEARLGLMVCFDWIFPEVSRLLTLRGACVLCHPSNLVLPYAQDAMKTRCIENRVFAVTANRIGTERRGTVTLTFTGGSQIIGPTGEVLASAGDRSESLKVVDVNIEEAKNKNVTPSNDILDDRVPSCYTTICSKKR